jgi:hypothetical protein
MKLATVLALGLTSIVLAGPSLAASGQTSIALSASLNAKQQVPPQVYKATGASGRFTGTLTHTGSSGGGKLSWHLIFANLSSPVTVADVFVPPAGKGGEVVVQLCSRCAATSTGVTETLSANVAKAISTRASYVVIGTKKNPSGEIRGRMTVTRG